jgi:hypothetical protein
LEVEKKSTTPYSPKKDSQRSRKAEDSLSVSPLHFPPAVLDPNENQRGIGKETVKEMTKMDKSKMQNSFSGAIISKVSTFHLCVVEWATRSFQKASLEVGRALKDAARMLRIITFLHSAKDLQSVLRLYGIEDSHACQSSNEM